MASQTIPNSRIQRLNDRDIRKGDYVLYWMQQSQRAEYNHALEYAVQQANGLGQGVLVAFGLTDDYPEANLRHYTFMLEGLRETQASLADRGIKMVLRLGTPADVALDLGQRASLIVCDRGYLRHQTAWRTRTGRSAACSVRQVESDVVVPVEAVSNKAEYAARTIRPKIHKLLRNHMAPFDSSTVKKSSLGLNVNGLDLQNIHTILKKLSLDRNVEPVTRFFKGGTSQAKSRFDEFIKKRFKRYVNNRNQPQTDDISQMSPYLHFGQVSPLYLALQVSADGSRYLEAQEAFLEELIVRRELAINFVHFNPKYNAYSCLPQWAQKTLKEHQKDPRDNVSTRNQ
jgi:deoxyribodipyrimidine photo-lyase